MLSANPKVSPIQAFTERITLPLAQPIISEDDSAPEFRKPGEVQCPPEN